MKTTLNWTRRDWIAVLGVTLLGAVLRLYRLGAVPPGFQFDEAFNAIDAKLVLAGNRPLFLPANGGREVLYTYWQALLGAFLGVDAFSLRLASAIFGILAIPVAYLLVRRMLRRDSFRVALFTSLTLAITIWPIHFSRFGIRVIMMPVIFSAVFGLFWLGGHASTRRRRLWAYAASGLFLGLGPWTHPTGRIAPLALIAYVVWLLWREPEQRRIAWDSLLGGLTLAGGVALAVFLPLGFDFFRHPDFFFGHASEVSIFAERVSGGSPLAALMNNLLHVLGMFSFFGDREWTHGLAGRPVLDPLMSIPFVIGLGLWIWRLRRTDDPDFDALSLLMFWSLVMLLPSVFSDSAPNYSRTLPALPAIFVAAGLGLTWLASLRKPASWVGPILAAAIVVVSAGWTAYDYFDRFANAEEVYYLYDANKLDALDALRALTADNQVYLSQLWGEKHATIWFLRGQYGIASIDVSDTLVLPPAGKGAVYAFPHEQEDRAERLAALWPQATLERLPDRYGRDLLSVVTIPADAAAHWPPGQEPTTKTEAHFSEAPTLLGMAANDEGEITLYWRGEEPMLRDLTSFIHLLDADGRMVGQADKQPGSGSYATPVWNPGERVMERYRPRISDLCAGGEEVRVEVGWYQLLADGMRMPRTDAPGDTALAGRMTLPLYSQPLDEFEPEQPLDRPLGDLTLFGYDLLGEIFQPGAPLVLDLYWEGDPAGAQTPITVQLIDGKSSSPLWRGELAPDAHWAEGEGVCRRLRLRLPEDIAPGQYALQVTTVDEVAGVTDLTVEESTRTFVPPPMEQMTNALFSDASGVAIKLLGYNSQVRGDELAVTLVWQALAAPAGRYKAFLHLLDGDGQIVAQSDAEPGGYATTEWIANEVVVDEHGLPLPAAGGGSYRLRVGLYDAVSGERLPVVDEDGQPVPDSALDLGEVTLP